MAVTFVRTHTAVSIKTAGTTNLGVNISTATTAGNTLIARILFDNAGTASKPVVSSIAKMAGETNSWVFLGAARSTSTSAGAFASGEMWAIQTTVAWSVATYTVTLDTSVTMKANLVQEFSGVLATLRSTVGTAYSTTTTAASAATTGTTPVTGDLTVGFIFGSNVAAAQAGDTDTTGGSWSTASGLGSTGSGAATNNFGIAQYKILTGTNHQTLNNSAAMTAGNGSIVAILQQYVPPAITQAASRFYADGTETGSTALAAQDATPSVDVTSTDVNLQLRTRLQSTTAVAVNSTDDFQLQWDKNTSGAWANVSTGIGYDESHYDTDYSAYVSVGQSFKGDGTQLTKAAMYVKKWGTPPAGDYVNAYLYTHSGTYGVNGTFGSNVASATPVPVTNLTTSYGWMEFTFDGTFTLVADTPYFLIVEAHDFDGGATFGADASSPTHAGNSYLYDGETSSVGGDLLFRINTPPSVIAYASTNLTDGAATTNRLTGGTGTFTAGKISEDGLVDDLGWAGNNHTELLYSLTLKKDSLVNGDAIRFRVLRNGVTTGLTYTQTPTIDVVKATLATQAAYGFYEGDEASASILGAQDTPYAHSIDSDRYFSVRVRLQAGSTAPPSTSDWQLQYEKNTSGTWVNVTASSVGIQSVEGYLTNNAATTNRLTGGSGSFVAGKCSTDGLVEDFGWTANNFTELLYECYSVSADFVNGDTLRFRVTSDVLYSVYPTLNLYKTTTLDMEAYRWYADGTESGSTAAAAQDTIVAYRAGTTNNIQLRMRLKTNVVLPATADLTLRVGSNSGNLAPVTSSTDVAIYNSASLTDGAATTNRLTGGTGTFTAGKISEDGVVDDITWPVANYTEILFALTAKNTIPAGALRVFDLTCSVAGSGVSMDAEPRIIVGDAAGLATSQWGKDDASETSLASATDAVRRAPGSAGFILRYALMLITQSPAIAATSDWQLQYDKNSSGSWVNVSNANTDIKGFDSTQYTDGQTMSSHRINSGLLPPLFEGKVSEDGLIDDMGGTNWVGSLLTEFVYALNLPATTTFIEGDLLRFRVLLNGTPLPDYQTNPARLLVAYPLIKQSVYCLYDINSTATGGTQLSPPGGGVYIAAADTSMQVRIALANPNGPDAVAQAWQLQYDKNYSGSWTNVAGGAQVIPVNAANLTDDAATSNVFYVPEGGTFQAGRISEDGLTVASVDIPTGYFVEHLYAFQVRGSVLTTGDVIRLRVVGTETFQTYQPIDYPMITVGATPTVNVVAYRWERDDGSESAASAYAGQDSAATVYMPPASTIKIRLRILVQNTTSTAIHSTDLFRLECEKNLSGTWSYSDGGGVFGSTHTSAPDGTPTTNRLTGGTGSFQPGKVGATWTVDDVGIPANGFTELVYTMWAPESSVAEGLILRFRLRFTLNLGNVTQSVTPRVNWTKIEPVASTPRNVRLGNAALQRSFSR